MKLKKTDYVLECTFDGGYYAWLTVNMQCNAYGDSPEEAVDNLQQTMEELRVKSEVLYLCKIVDTIRNLPFSLFPLPALSSSLY